MIVLTELRKQNERDIAALIKPVRPVTPWPRVLRRMIEKIQENPAPNHCAHLGPCWLWTGARSGRRYGTFSFGAHTYYTHRVLYTHLIGPIPEGLELDHLCKRILCCSPWHMEPVTKEVNLSRKSWYFRTMDKFWGSCRMVDMKKATHKKTKFNIQCPRCQGTGRYDRGTCFQCKGGRSIQVTHKPSYDLRN